MADRNRKWLQKKKTGKKNTENYAIYACRAQIKNKRTHTCTHTHAYIEETTLAGTTATTPIQTKKQKTI